MWLGRNASTLGISSFPATNGMASQERPCRRTRRCRRSPPQAARSNWCPSAPTCCRRSSRCRSGSQRHGGSRARSDPRSARSLTFESWNAIVEPASAMVRLTCWRPVLKSAMRATAAGRFDIAAVVRGLGARERPDCVHSALELQRRVEAVERRGPSEDRRRRRNHGRCNRDGTQSPPHAGSDSAGLARPSNASRNAGTCCLAAPRIRIWPSGRPSTNSFLLRETISRPSYEIET